MEGKMKVKLELSEKEAKNFFKPKKNKFKINQDVKWFLKQPPTIFVLVVVSMIFLIFMFNTWYEDSKAADINDLAMLNEQQRLMELPTESVYELVEKRTVIWFGQSINAIGFLLGIVLLIHGFKVIGR